MSTVLATARALRIKVGKFTGWSFICLSGTDCLGKPLSILFLHDGTGTALDFAPMGELVDYVVDTFLNSHEFKHVLNAGILFLWNFIWLFFIEIKVEMGPAESWLAPIHHVFFEIVVTRVVFWSYDVAIASSTWEFRRIVLEVNCFLFLNLSLTAAEI